MNFKSELTVLISQYYKEFPSNTPDYVLAEYMVGCLRVFNKTVKQREAYYGNESKRNTPDYILAEYMVGCLRVFNKTVKQREAYYGNESKVDTTTPTTSSCI